MKAIVAGLMATVFSVGALAAEFKTGSFQMFSETVPNETCAIGTNLIMDEAQVAGKVALLSNFVRGMCEIYVYPDARFVRIDSVESDPCQSVISRGRYESTDGILEIEIVDHRGRRCKDMIPASVVMTTKNLQTGWHQVQFSYDR